MEAFVTTQPKFIMRLVGCASSPVIFACCLKKFSNYTLVTCFKVAAVPKSKHMHISSHYFYYFISSTVGPFFSFILLLVLGWGKDSLCSCLLLVLGMDSNAKSIQRHVASTVCKWLYVWVVWGRHCGFCCSYSNQTDIPSHLSFLRSIGRIKISFSLQLLTYIMQGWSTA